MNASAAFSKFDSNQKGHLSLFETKCALLAVTGMKVRKKELLAMFPSEEVSLHDLIVLAEKYKPDNPLSSAFLSALADEKGECSLDRFRTLALRVGMANATEVFLEIDKRKRGVVDLGDFLEFIN